MLQQHIRRFLLTATRVLGRALLRAAVTGVVFILCLLAAARYTGQPVPTPSELLERFESVSRLAEILS
ncbi:MAG: hypothetical protein ACRD9R_09410 [Pyrinomonadaceae bacterium]